MSSAASELSALGQCMLVDFYKRRARAPLKADRHYVRAAQLFTAGVGRARRRVRAGRFMLDNLIQAVNILGSLFYGTILGIFLVAFFVRRVRATPVFVAALVSEAIVFAIWLGTSVGFLWFNVIGCAAVVGLAFVFDALTPRHNAAP